MTISIDWIDYDFYVEKLEEFSCLEESIYHTKEWISVLKAGLNADVKFLHTADEKSSLAIMPVIVKRLSIISAAGSPLKGFYCDYMGPIYAQHLRANDKLVILDQQLSFLKAQFHYVEVGLKTIINLGDEDPIVFATAGYEFFSKDTLVLDLQKGEDAVWKGFESRARNTIRKAKKKNLDVCELNADMSWVDGYYDLLTNVFGRQGRRAPHPISLYKQLQSLMHQGVMTGLGVFIDHKLVAAGLFLRDRGRMVYFSGATSREGSRLGAPSLIQWHAIKIALNENFTEFDLGGLGVPSIDKFKRSFGGNPVKYHRIVYIQRPLKWLMPLAKWLIGKKLVKINE